ncbi:MAG: tetratricopeptide repeat protein [Fuerstiella sp.]
MRRISILTLLVFLAGCGSKTPEQAASVGIPLAINSAVATNNVSADAAATAKPTATQTVANPAVDQLIQKAKAAVVAGRPSVAIEALSQAIAVSPGDSKLFRLRADVYVLMGENANAQVDFNLAVSLDPQNAELLNVRGYFLMTRGLTDQACADFDKAIQFDPKLTAAWNNRGLVGLSRQNYAAAEADFNKAVELDRKYADGLNNRGFARMKQGKLDEALADLKATTELKPDYTTAWNNCGLTYLQQENYPAAIEAFSKAVSLAPTDTRWLNHRRAAYLKMEKYEEANKDAQQIRWLTGLNQLTQQAFAKAATPDVWIQRANYLVEGSEFGAAVQDYSRALAIAPGNINALNGRAYAWLKTGEVRKSIADCDESIVSKPTPAAYSVRGDAWFALQNYDQAVQDFEAAQRFDETVAAAYRHRADEREKSGNAELAKADTKKAEQITAALAGELGTATDGQAPAPFPEN